MPTADLGPKFWVRLRYAASRQLHQYTQSREGRVFLTTDHVGTHLDGPLRFDPKGAAVKQLPLDRVNRPARLLDLRHVTRGSTIGPRDLERAGPALGPGDAAVAEPCPRGGAPRPRRAMLAAMWGRAPARNRVFGAPTVRARGVRGLFAAQEILRRMPA